MDLDEETAPLLGEGVSSMIENEDCVAQDRPMKHVVAVLMIALFTAVFVILCLTFGVLSPDVVPQNAGTCPILGCHNISEAMLLLQSPSYKCLDVYTEFGQLVCEIKEDQRGGTVSIGISTQYSLEVVYEVPFEWLQQHVSFRLTSLCKPSLLRHRKLYKLKNAYQACMDEEGTTPESSKRLANAIREVVDHLPTWNSFSIYFPMGSLLNTSRTTTEASWNQELVDARAYLAGLGCWPPLQTSFEPIIRDLEATIIELFTLRLHTSLEASP